MNIRMVDFKSSVRSAPASSGAEIQVIFVFNEVVILRTFALVECAFGVARGECADLGVARGECAGLGVARVEDLVTAEKQESGMEIRARRDAKTGIRNALASSGAEIQVRFVFSSRIAINEKSRINKRCKGVTLRFLASRATAKFC